MPGIDYNTDLNSLWQHCSCCSVGSIQGGHKRMYASGLVNKGISESWLRHFVADLVHSIEIVLAMWKQFADWVEQYDIPYGR